MYSVQWSQTITPFYPEQFVIRFLSIPTLTKDNAEKNELQIQLNRKAKLQIAPKALTKLHSAGEKDYWLPFPFQLFRWFLKLLDLTEILKKPKIEFRVWPNLQECLENHFSWIKPNL